METYIDKQTIISQVKLSQDNHTLAKDDQWGCFLLGLIDKNTSPDSDSVNLSDLLMDLGYTLQQFESARERLYEIENAIEQAGTVTYLRRANKRIDGTDGLVYLELVGDVYKDRIFKTPADANNYVRRLSGDEEELTLNDKW